MDKQQTQRAIDALTEPATLNLINELVSDAPPMGAYFMGLASAACAQRGVRPDRQLMLAMRGASHVLAAEVLLNRWLEVHR